MDDSQTVQSDVAGRHVGQNNFGKRMTGSRQIWVIAHRCAGLTIALFLIVAGTTGSLMPFYEELTDLTQPWRVIAPPHPGAPLLDPATLSEAASRAAPAGYWVNGLRLNVEPGRALEIGLERPWGSGLPPLDAAIDPYTGKLVHIGEPGAIMQDWDQTMPFLYSLHQKLAIEKYGSWALGVAALIWTLDCFVGFYLTLPRTRRRWWAHWRKSWRMRTPVTRKYKLNVDLHLATGLWLWPILLVFAWSAVGMNLRQVYDPVMAAFGAHNPYTDMPDQAAPEDFKPDWRAAHAQARSLASREGIAVAHEHSMYFDGGKNVFSYNFASTRDFTDKGGWSAIFFHPDGRLVRTIIADGGLNDGGADSWFMALHMAQVGGLAYRIFVSVLGLVIVMLSVTGVIIWTKKRSARIARSGRRARVRSKPTASGSILAR